MKSFTIIAVLGASLAAAADASISTTVVCSSCPSITATTPDVVTRSDVPTTPCTAPALTIISSASASSGNATSYAGTGATKYTATAMQPSSTFPVTVSGGKKMVSNCGGAFALAAAIAYLA
ncbi:hypothetical protein SCAR479_02810 [Seiridium cardinale]|uniref:Antifreeze protein n=1 Tax=Seiridium cardinale TaxID=138064 RepID=A0ABR2Y293_9PEZI